MILRFNLGKNFPDLSFLINQKGHAVVSHVGSAHEFFLAVRSKRFREFALGIGEQAKRQIVLFGKLLVGLFVVQRDAKNFDTAFFEFGERVAE